MNSFVRFLTLFSLLWCSSSFADSTTVLQGNTNLRYFKIAPGFQTTLGLSDDPSRSLAQSGAVPRWAAGSATLWYPNGTASDANCNSSYDILTATNSCYVGMWGIQDCSVRVAYQDCSGMSTKKIVFYNPASSGFTWTLYNSTQDSSKTEVGGAFLRAAMNILGVVSSDSTCVSGGNGGAGTAFNLVTAKSRNALCEDEIDKLGTAQGGFLSPSSCNAGGPFPCAGTISKKSTSWPSPSSTQYTYSAWLPWEDSIQGVGWGGFSVGYKSVGFPEIWRSVGMLARADIPNSGHPIGVSDTNVNDSSFSWGPTQGFLRRPAIAFDTTRLEWNMFAQPRGEGGVYIKRYTSTDRVNWTDRGYVHWGGNYLAPVSPVQRIKTRAPVSAAFDSKNDVLVVVFQPYDPFNSGFDYPNNSNHDALGVTVTRPSLGYSESNWQGNRIPFTRSASIVSGARRYL